jgi:uncharacterized protein
MSGAFLMNVIHTLFRASAITCLTLTFSIGASSASEPLLLGWDDLLPSEAYAIPENSALPKDDEETSPFGIQPPSTGVRAELDGKLVTLPGFVLPLDYDGTRVTTFMLAPFIGACIHVPPPPSNQLVFVDTPAPYEVEGLFEPVYITGVLRVQTTSTEFADTGYSITADKIEPYE